MSHLPVFGCGVGSHPFIVAYPSTFFLTHPPHPIQSNPIQAPTVFGVTSPPTQQPTAAPTAGAYFWSIGGSVDDISGSTAVRYINLAAATPSWVTGPTLSVTRGSAGTAGLYSAMANAWGNYIYVFGGSDSGFYFQGLMVRLDVTASPGTWSSVSLGAVTPLVRYNGVSATLNDVFYYVGGFNSNAGNAFVLDTSSFDPSTGVLTNTVTGATLPAAVASTTATSRGCVVAVGGALYYMRNALLYKWAPGDSSWTAITTSAPWQNSGTPSCAAYDGKVVQMVGTTSTVYDPVGGTFAALPGTSTRIHNYPVAAGCGSKIVAPVGSSSNPIQVDLYNGTWGAFPNLVQNLAAQYMTTVCSNAVPPPPV